jgi:hypothetical protein
VLGSGSKWCDNVCYNRHIHRHGEIKKIRSRKLPSLREGSMVKVTLNRIQKDEKYKVHWGNCDKSWMNCNFRNYPIFSSCSLLH